MQADDFQPKPQGSHRLACDGQAPIGLGDEVPEWRRSANERLIRSLDPSSRFG
jgi:hypothetical protein